MRIYDKASGILYLSPLLSGPSRAFHLAHQIALLGQSQKIEELVSDANFTTEDAKSICRVGLANYFAEALVCPTAPSQPRPAPSATISSNCKAASASASSRSATA